MNTGAEAADQVVKFTLEGAEFIIRLAGSGAKHAAVMLYAVIKEQHKTSGAERLGNMLRSGKPLKVYTFASSDMEQFKKVAKQYGILYTILKDKSNTGGVFDVFVRADDESKINRIVSRFQLTKIDTATLKAEILKEKESRENQREGESAKAAAQEAASAEERPSDVPEEPTVQEIENIYEEGVAEMLLSEKPIQKEETTYANPDAAQADLTDQAPSHSVLGEKKNPQREESDNLSEPASVASSQENESVFPFHEENERRSVREKIEQIKKERETSKRTSPSVEPAKVPTPKTNER